MTSKKFAFPGLALIIILLLISVYWLIPHRLLPLIFNSSPADSSPQTAAEVTPIPDQINAPVIPNIFIDPSRTVAFNYPLDLSFRQTENKWSFGNIFDLYIQDQSSAAEMLNDTTNAGTYKVGENIWTVHQQISEQGTVNAYEIIKNDISYLIVALNKTDSNYAPTEDTSPVLLHVLTSFKFFNGRKLTADEAINLVSQLPEISPLLGQKNPTRLINQGLDPRGRFWTVMVIRSGKGTGCLVWQYIPSSNGYGYVQTGNCLISWKYYVDLYTGTITPDPANNTLPSK